MNTYKSCHTHAHTYNAYSHRHAHKCMHTRHCTNQHAPLPCIHYALSLLTFLNDAHLPLHILWPFILHTNITFLKCSYALWSYWVPNLWNRPKVVKKRSWQRIWHFGVVLSCDNYELIRGRRNVDKCVYPGIQKCFPCKLISSIIK